MKIKVIKHGVDSNANVIISGGNVITEIPWVSWIGSQLEVDIWGFAEILL